MHLFYGQSLPLKKQQLKAEKFLSKKTEVTLSKLISLLYWLQGSVIEPTGIHDDGLSLIACKFLEMENHSTGG